MKYLEFAKILDEQGETPCMAYPDAFFNDESERSKYYIARSLCHSCPIRLQCLEYAITNEERFGLWGGLSPRERMGLSDDRAA